MPVSSFASADDPRRFSRTVDLYGAEGFGRLRGSLMVVVGLGGVGSHAAVALARSGVGRLRLVDHDEVTWSGLNRHAFAGPADVGRPKAAVCADGIGRVAPSTVVETLELFCHHDSLDEVVLGEPDVVIDAVDALAPKVALLAGCLGRGLPVVSSMGASSRTDPARLRWGDLADSRVCPLARRVRKALRREGVDRGVLAVWSEESPRDPLPPDLSEPRLERGRVRNRQPSASALPGIFGYALAELAIGLLTGRARD